jgi:threonylcarbamoyladenosine tRNA methylthiotransferase MtaB
MENQVSEQVKTLRSNQMLELDKQKREAYEARFVGTEVEVLMEESVTIGGTVYQVGHTKEYVKIALETEMSLQNQLVKVQITDASQIIH